MSALMALTSAVGLLAQVVLFRVVGVGAPLDFFFRLASVPFAIAGISSSAVAMVLVPEFVRIRTNPSGADEARSLLGALFLLAAGVVAFGVTLTIAVDGAARSQHGVSIVSFWTMAGFTIVTQGLSAFHYAQGSFALPAATNALIPIGLLVGAILGFPLLGIEGVALCYVAGSGIQTLILGADARVRPVVGIPSRLRHGALFLTMAPVAMAVLPNALVSATDAFWTKEAPAGLYASMSFALRVCVAIVSLVTNGVATVGFPELSAHGNANNTGAAREAMGKTLSGTACLVAAISFLLYLAKDDVVSILVRRPGSGASDSRWLAQVFPWYLLGMVALGWSNVAIRGFYAFKRTNLLAVAGVLGALTYFSVGGVLASRGWFAALPAAYAASFTVFAIVHSRLLDRLFGQPSLLIVALRSLPSVAGVLLVILACRGVVLALGGTGWNSWARLSVLATLSAAVLLVLVRKGRLPSLDLR